jgi:hypothetical protein
MSDKVGPLKKTDQEKNVVELNFIFLLRRQTMSIVAKKSIHLKRK